MDNRVVAAAATLLALRISFNPLILFRLARQPLTKDGRRRGYSLDLVTEPCLLLLLIFYSALSSGSAWFNYPFLVGMVGAGAVVGSYLLIIPVIWMMHRWECKKPATRRRLSKG